LLGADSFNVAHRPHLRLLFVIGRLILKDMYFLQHWVIDWDKVKTQEDLITILKNLNLGFERPSEDLKKLCKFVNKSDGEEVTFD